MDQSRRAHPAVKAVFGVALSGLAAAGLARKDPVKPRAFVSPDPHRFRPEGGARVLWSKDSTKALVLDRTLHYGSGEWLTTGEAPLFLYDFAAGKLYCAVAAWGQASFALKDLAGVDFGEPLAAGPDPWAAEKARLNSRVRR
jgi:hypothetical protein